jgi:hypothetical protein
LERWPLKIHLKGLNIRNYLFLEYLQEFPLKPTGLMPYRGRTTFAFLENAFNRFF